MRSQGEGSRRCLWQVKIEKVGIGEHGEIVLELEVGLLSLQILF